MSDEIVIPKKAPGRKKHTGAYKPEYCDLVIDYAKQVKHIPEFAAAIGIARSTVNRWAEVYPEFGAALEIARTILLADSLKRLEEALSVIPCPCCKTKMVYDKSQIALLLYKIKIYGREDFLEPGKTDNPVEKMVDNSKSVDEELKRMVAANPELLKGLSSKN